ncbi:glycosyl hydrolase 115 family protein [Tunicatimonas pelagia]|uniref:glycosyl hydrolase 115 family protein n=1 Tax=Tunicatimonas pelagia TaxID=931531 RepID=UPI00266578D8|nr:glycosyl hydrolase 115 family protein [Tunicatimonas pelagia]WKN43855.1 glycosyl hydrolase 115 family protein [Tunicatimonas pelagia]
MNQADETTKLRFSKKYSPFFKGGRRETGEGGFLSKSLTNINLSLVLVLVISTLATCQDAAPALILVDNTQSTNIYLPEGTSNPVRLAVDDIRSDVEKITGKQLLISEKLDTTASQMLVFNLADEIQRGEAIRLHPDLDTLVGKWEAYVVQNISVNGKQHLLMAGSDERATMFAIYHFAEDYLSVDPTYYWSGLEPTEREQLAWEEVRIVQDEPTFRFRGWFINDEDLLTEWKNGGGARNIDYRFYSQVVHPEVIRPALETALRLRMNLIIPASFVDIRNPPEERLVAEAAQRGLYVSMHHIEPLGVSAFGYQNYWQEQGEEPLFSFYSEPEKVTQTWQEYAQRWAKYPNVIWQTGLRGIADRPMWMADPGVPQSDADRGRIISEAIRVQSEIVDTLDEGKNPILSTTLWAEGAGLNQAGHLTFPDSMIIIFADNSPGWRWQSDFYETERNPANRYGVYYHHQLWGSGPHLVQAVPPAKTYEMFEEAVEHQASDYAIMNVSNVREFVLGIEASAEMLYDMQSFEVAAFMSQWFVAHFGEQAESVQKLYQRFFDSYQTHKTLGVPLLLDGQIRSYGYKVLNRLKMQVEQPEKYQEILAQEATPTVESIWASRHLSDMHPANSLPPEEVLVPLQQQIQSLEGMEGSLEQAASQLSGDTLLFFQTNLVAQHKILLELNRWLEAVVLSRLAMDENNAMAASMHLLRAVEFLERVEEAKKIASQGEKWQHWYRGDKKMNIAGMIESTKQVHQLMVERFS